MCGGQLREEQSEHQKIEIFLWVVCLFVCLFFFIHQKRSDAKCHITIWMNNSMDTDHACTDGVRVGTRAHFRGYTNDIKSFINFKIFFGSVLNKNLVH